MSISVILADDHPVVRDGLRYAIENKAPDIRVIGEAANGQALLALAQTQPADVYILDITMPVMNGIETARRLVKANPEAKVIMLSIHDTRDFVEQAMAAGARGYLVKENATRSVVEAIREVHRGCFFLSPEISGLLVGALLAKDNAPRPASGLNSLTAREREVLQLIGEGLGTKDIAVKLELAVSTAHIHISNLMKKLDIHKQVDLARYALREGLAKL